VDVPGHERFIKNMLAGVSGIDLVLLVIAADEGVMPQTREHFDILQLLRVKNGIIVLTKVDLVDEEWLELVKEEIKEFFSDTSFENAPMIPVSSMTGEGLPTLLETIDNMVQNIEERTDIGKMRLPVDRVFTVPGFGTVVTGTMASGRLSIGDEVVLMPTNICSRVRGLQVHGNKEEFAQAGQRLAVNLASVEVAEIQRGNVLCTQGALKPSYRLDVKIHLLDNTVKPLLHRTRIRMHIGTDEIISRVIMFDRDQLRPGEDAYVQLQLEDTAVVSKGDRFVIRRLSPMQTIGGGVVIDPLAQKHKLYKKDVIEILRTKEQGTADELLQQFLSTHPLPVTAASASEEANVTAADWDDALNKLLKEDKVKLVLADNENMLIYKERYLRWVEQITVALKEYHGKYALREGYPKEELRSRMFAKLNIKVFLYLLQQMDNDGYIKVNPQTVRLPEFTGLPTGNDVELITTIEYMLKKNIFQPPNWNEIVKQLSLTPDQVAEYQAFLLRTDKILKIEDNIYFHIDGINKAKETIAQYIKEKGKINLGETRDVLKTSRKYALPLLLYLDRSRFTRRNGDDRVLGAKA
jgi:selenocysteine-specific elongation factor